MLSKWFPQYHLQIMGGNLMKTELVRCGSQVHIHKYVLYFDHSGHYVPNHIVNECFFLSFTSGSQFPPSLTKEDNQNRRRKPSISTDADANKDDSKGWQPVIENDGAASISMSEMDYIFFGDVSSSNTDSDMDDIDWIP